MHNRKKYDQRTQDHEGTPRVFDKEIKEFNREKFGEDIQKILDLFQFEGELRRQIFSQLMEYASESAQLNAEHAQAEQQAGNPQKGSQNDQR